ncbi:MAG: tocopherol cyclase family protein, partial [Candidatus Saccharibacteria bacterium]
LESNKKQGIKPSYAMLKAGTWCDNPLQIHNFYAINDFSASFEKMDVRIGECKASENHLQGFVRLSPEEAAAHPEFMSDAGEMTWDLKVTKPLAYSVGYGASKAFRDINAFAMFWHVQGIKCLYEGTITVNGEEFIVKPETSYGYQDKNWGCDYTNPWIWLNCNNFTSKTTGKKLTMTSLDVGGGSPVVFGARIDRKLLIALFYEGQLYEYNFSKSLLSVKQEFNCRETDDSIIWDITAVNSDSKITINFSCPKKTMILVNYENPDGEKNHDRLWNGGWASGELKLYKKIGGRYELIDELYGENGGCEYGEYDEGAAKKAGAY